MANICDVSARICGSHEDIKRLYNIAKDMAWLGDLVNALGGNADDIYCRGEIYDCDHELYEVGGELRLYISSAWREPYEVFAFLHERFPDITIYYTAEEPGCDYFVTNDPEAPLYISDFDDQVEYHDCIEDLLACAEETFERKFTSTRGKYAALDELDKFLEDKRDYYAKFEFQQRF